MKILEHLKLWAVPPVSERASPANAFEITPGTCSACHQQTAVDGHDLPCPQTLGAALDAHWLALGDQRKRLAPRPPCLYGLAPFSIVPTQERGNDQQTHDQAYRRAKPRTLPPFPSVDAGASGDYVPTQERGNDQQK